MNRVYMTDIGSLVSEKIGSAFASATAGGTGDNTAVTGTSIDRAAIGNPLCAEVAVLYSATLAATKTLTLKTVKIEDSADGSTWADYATFDDAVVATGATGGSTEAGAAAYKVNLSGARRYVRVDFTPDLSATGTDTASAVAAWVFGGFDVLPVA